MQRLRPRHHHRLRPRHPRPVQEPRGRRGEALADRRQRRLPDGHDERGGQEEVPDQDALPRPVREVAALGHRRRPRLRQGQEPRMAQGLVWGEGLLPLVGIEVLQDARPCAPLALPRLHEVPGVRRQTAPARSAFVSYRWRNDEARRPKAKYCVLGSWPSGFVIDPLGLLSAPHPRRFGRGRRPRRQVPAHRQRSALARAEGSPWTARLLGGSRPRLSHARPRHAHLVRRRNRPGQPHDLPRLAFGEHALRAR